MADFLENEQLCGYCYKSEIIGTASSMAYSSSAYLCACSILHDTQPQLPVAIKPAISTRRVIASSMYKIIYQRPNQGRIEPPPKAGDGLMRPWPSFVPRPFHTAFFAAVEKTFYTVLFSMAVKKLCGNSKAWVRGYHTPGF